MKVEGSGPLRGAASTRRTNRADGSAPGAFARALQEEGGQAPGVGSTASSGVAALLAAQEVGDATSGPSKGRARARARAEAMLDQLDELRVGLLTGTLSRASLQELARLSASRRDEVSDPGMAAVLDEIDLRVQVELAKLDAGL